MSERSTSSDDISPEEVEDTGSPQPPAPAAGDGGAPAERGEPDAAGHQMPERLPLLAVRDAVVFPGTIMPLTVDRPRSKRVIESAAAGRKLIGIITQRRKETEDPTLEDLYRVGTACLILKLITLPDSSVSLIVHGMTRIGIESIDQHEPFLIGRVHPRDDISEAGPEIDALVHNAREMAHQIIEMSEKIPDEARVVLDNIETPGGVADFLAANLSIGTPSRQELLETLDVATRLRKINTALAEQVELLELSSKIHSQIREQMNKSQRQYYLQEQLKAIQKELGEEDARTVEIQRLTERIEQAKMTETAEREAHRELARLSRIPQASPEYSVALDYIEWLTDLPWSVSTEDRLDLRRARKILDQDHYDLEKVKQRIIEFLAVRKLKPDGRGPILCFVGPPGVGKTSLGQSIARALGRKFVRFPLGGMHDEAQLRGHRRTYIGAMPGRIIQELRKAESNNPVVMLDEVDKLGQDFRGDPASALLEILDPWQNHAFTDNYLDVPFDLSRVMFIATANTIDPVPMPLRDRMEIIRLAGYTNTEKVFIARKYLLPRQLAENGLTRDNLKINDKALEAIATGYTREAGVRDLERQIGIIARGVAAQVAGGKRKTVSITPDSLKKHLGAERFTHEAARATSVPGVATGLAYTPVGGEILFIEATSMPGKGHLTLTGQIGDVMRESALAAFSIVRSRARELKIDPRVLAESDLHVHVPAGAIPKDGPSAGVAMLTAIVSLFTGRPCRHDVAMTGEITLTGRVMPIGGVKEKVLAAHRAGIARVILPDGNRKDLADIPAEVRQQMKFTFVDKAEKVLRAALEAAK